MGQKLKQLKAKLKLTDIACAELINYGMTSKGLEHIDKQKILYAINNDISKTSENLLCYVLLTEYDSFVEMFPDFKPDNTESTIPCVPLGYEI